MGSKRILGVGLKLTLDGTDYWADVTSCRITSEDADVTTFEDAAAGGGRKYMLALSALQSTDSDALWSYIWDNAGDEVAFVYAPHGNESASATEPHFTGTVRIGNPPDVGGDAGINNTYSFDASWHIVSGKPTKVVTGA